VARGLILVTIPCICLRILYRYLSLSSYSHVPHLSVIQTPLVAQSFRFHNTATLSQCFLPDGTYFLLSTDVPCNIPFYQQTPCTRHTFPYCGRYFGTVCSHLQHRCLRTSIRSALLHNKRISLNTGHTTVLLKS
jgi:hypothetical protein